MYDSKKYRWKYLSPKNFDLKCFVGVQTTWEVRTGLLFFADLKECKKLSNFL